MSTDVLITRYADEWFAASTGDLPEPAFNRWLEQDYQFVLCLLRAQARILADAPRSGRGALAQGLAALAAELDWFEGHLKERGLSRDTTLLPACRRWPGGRIALASWRSGR
jgi:thiaminase/transcriptional activator TenA